ncbi:MAG: hypothetical protein R3A10_16655 [Caldilineaceae bacterium]
MHIIDRLLYQSGTTGDVDLTQWDAVSVYLNVRTARPAAVHRRPPPIALTSNCPGRRSRPSAGALFRGDGRGWVAAPVDFTAETSWRGMDGPNAGRDASSGLGRQPDHSICEPGVDFAAAAGHAPRALVLHDRDGLDMPVVHTRWPATWT